jgi:hypothetical protein
MALTCFFRDQWLIRCYLVGMRGHMISVLCCSNWNISVWHWSLLGWSAMSVWSSCPLIQGLSLSPSSGINLMSVVFACFAYTKLLSVPAWTVWWTVGRTGWSSPLNSSCFSLALPYDVLWVLSYVLLYSWLNPVSLLKLLGCSQISAAASI